MKIIAVASPGSGSGKTLFIERLLEAFPGIFTAVKFTHAHDEAASPDDPRKDTARFRAAGARRALLWTAPAGHEEGAWLKLSACQVLPTELLVLEGNRAARVSEPGLLFFVVDPEKPRDEWKPGTGPLIEAADAVIWRGPRPDPSLLPRAPRLILGGDMTKPLRESFPEAASLIEELIARPQS